MNFNGIGVKRGKALGATYIELVAKQGLDTAQFSLREIYTTHGSIESGRPWFEKAAD